MKSPLLLSAPLALTRYPALVAAQDTVAITGTVTESERRGGSNNPCKALKRKQTELGQDNDVAPPISASPGAAAVRFIDSSLPSTSTAEEKWP